MSLATSSAALAMAPFGQALADHLAGRTRGPLVLSGDAPRASRIEIPTRLFFRDHSAFTPIDSAALAHCRGRIVDLGAGAGPHSLALQHAGHEVCAIDVSPQACEVLRRRGVREVRCVDLFELASERADTLLMLMNGIGLVGDLDGLQRFLRQAHRLITRDGQILVDSLDPEHGFAEEPTQGRQPSCGALGATRLRIEYGARCSTCSWLSLSAEQLALHAQAAGWSSRVLIEDGSGEYLAQLQPDPTWRAGLPTSPQ